MKLLRCAERLLFLAGVFLLAAACAATVIRWQYQSQQKRALFQEGPAISVVRAEKPEAVLRELPSRIELPVEEKHRVVKRDPAAFGLIEIPRLGIEAIVRKGADEKTLARAVGLIPGSAKPGQTGNIGLAGHRDTFFRELSGIAVNDRIRLVVPPNTYEYNVQSLRIVEPGEISVLDSHGIEELTLVTCYPFHFLGPAPQRFIVSAARVNGPETGQLLDLPDVHRLDRRFVLPGEDAALDVDRPYVLSESLPTHREP